MSTYAACTVTLDTVGLTALQLAVAMALTGASVGAMVVAPLVAVTAVWAAVRRRWIDAGMPE